MYVFFQSSFLTLLNKDQSNLLTNEDTSTHSDSTAFLSLELVAVTKARDALEETNSMLQGERHTLLVRSNQYPWLHLTALQAKIEALEQDTRRLDKVAAEKQEFSERIASLEAEGQKLTVRSNLLSNPETAFDVQQEYQASLLGEKAALDALRVADQVLSFTIF